MVLQAKSVKKHYGIQRTSRGRNYTSCWNCEGLKSYYGPTEGAHKVTREQICLPIFLNSESCQRFKVEPLATRGEVFQGDAWKWLSSPGHRATSLRFHPASCTSISIQLSVVLCFPELWTTTSRQISTEVYCCKQQYPTKMSHWMSESFLERLLYLVWCEAFTCNSCPLTSCLPRVHHEHRHEKKRNGPVSHRLNGFNFHHVLPSCFHAFHSHCTFFTNSVASLSNIC